MRQNKRTQEDKEPNRQAAMRKYVKDSVKLKRMPDHDNDGGYPRKASSLPYRIRIAAHLFAISLK
jgi:hypothetical protein